MLRSRWLTICAAVVVAVLGAVAIILLTTPLYAASTRLFVSTAASGSAGDLYDASRYSEQRVISYTQLVTGKTVAQRTIDKLGLGMSADELADRITAVAKPDTVLIDVRVLDESPVRARDIANTLSDEFVLMVHDLESPQNGSPSKARVVVEEQASIPDSPVVPNKTRIAGLGLAIGLLLGIGLAFLRDQLDNTVKDREALEGITKVGLVGSIPLDKVRRSDPPISFESDNTAGAEAFRRLRTNLQFLSVDSPPRVILVASSVPAEGKSTTAINLALVLAEAGHSVVVVDGDMRRPRLGHYLGVVGSVGFSTVLSGAVSLDDALQETRFSRLTVLTSGAVPPNPSELLGSLTARKVLSDLRARFDYVILDSSPLLAVTDAAILANSADGVLIMARFGQTKQEQLTHSIKSLHDVGATVLGAVFSMVPARGGSSYSYTYGYYSEDEDSSRRSRGKASIPSLSSDNESVAIRAAKDEAQKPA